MKHLSLSITREFTSEMERLRRSGFHDATGEATSSDEFDDSSFHCVVRLDGALAGLVRFTPNPPSIIQAWARGSAPLPHGTGVVDATRAVVSAACRGFGIYKLKMTEGLAWCYSAKAKTIVGIIKPTFSLSRIYSFEVMVTDGKCPVEWVFYEKHPIRKRSPNGDRIH